MSSLGILGQTQWVEGGTVVFTQTENEKTVTLGWSDPTYEPIIALTPVGDRANFTAWTATNITRTAGGWQFTIRRSIGGTVHGHLTELESMSVGYKAIGVKPKTTVGPTVTNVSEPG